jgi:hypothetical protein
VKAEKEFASHALKIVILFMLMALLIHFVI